MTVRTILQYPRPALTRAADPVPWPWGDDTRALLDDLAETMYASHAAGLAAPQVGIPLRAFVLDMAEEGAPAQLKYFVNPRILSHDGTDTGSEGCMSFSGVYERITRAAHVLVYAIDRDGRAFSLDTEAHAGLARAIQHEYDHLDGKLIIHRMGAHARRAVMQQMRARHRRRRPA